MNKPSQYAIPCSAALWRSFQSAAKKHRRDPVMLVSEFMEECLESWEDQQLDEEIRGDARRSGLRESDAVAIVRKHRREKRSAGGTA